MTDASPSTMGLARAEKIVLEAIAQGTVLGAQRVSANHDLVVDGTVIDDMQRDVLADGEFNAVGCELVLGEADVDDRVVGVERWCGGGRRSAGCTAGGQERR